MGFETDEFENDENWQYHLNYFPMGFETPYHAHNKTLLNIWTISLWDLKPKLKNTIEYLTIRFELFPYGIWNWPNANKEREKDSDLNYFPMGFETSF